MASWEPDEIDFEGEYDIAEPIDDDNLNYKQSDTHFERPIL